VSAVKCGQLPVVSKTSPLKKTLDFKQKINETELSGITKKGRHVGFFIFTGGKIFFMEKAGAVICGQLPELLFLEFPSGMPHFERKSSILAENRGYSQGQFPS
jgi:hypothetical protein